MLLSIYRKPMVRFVGSFIFFFLLFYYFIQIYEGITSPGGYYAPFLDHYCNFINWYRKLLLEAAHIIVNFMGYPNEVMGKYHLKLNDNISIQLVYSCLGFGLISVWFAFLLSYPSAWKKKIYWALIGFAIISILNIIRIAALAIIVTKVKLEAISTHHTIFNVVVYIFIILMIFFYTKEKKNKVSLSK